MKRTAERTLIIIAMVLHGLAVLSFGFQWMLAEVNMEMPEELAFGPQIIVALVANVAAILLAVMVLTLISTKAKKAGYWLIGMAAGLLLATLGGSIIPSVLYVIAGILCLKRRPEA
ncbi:hypothetical protein [Sinobaca sp. H24]|uniref:hypothetical protein n=1 Tax=Sinobaca sp. H24 TaxID=2923376 RepID=UPI00207AD865|nr:hypothetical protein [Sinobaca sp. H24]